MAKDDVDDKEEQEVEEEQEEGNSDPWPQELEKFYFTFLKEFY